MIPNRVTKIQVVAHRGASGYAPETTLEAYRLALETGVDFVEMDVHMLRDGTPVAIHDADVKRTTNGKGRISELTLAELKTLDAGSWFNRAYPQKARPEYIGLKVPTLEEVLKLTGGSSAGCYIEIKDPERYPPELESSVLSLVRKSRMEKRSRVISFSPTSIKKIKALDPSIQTGLLVSRRLGDPVRATIDVSADELAIRHDLVNAATVGSAHDKGLSVSVWTVDREQDMERMIRMGVDRITTDYPDLLLRLLGAAPR